MTIGPNECTRDQTTPVRYPALFRSIQHGPVRCLFELANEPPPDDQIGNVTIVPFVDNQVVILHLANGAVEVPGGTLEPNETYLDALRRELHEEAGAELLTYTPFGCWHRESSATQPYRPHLPHPHFCRLVGYGNITLIGNPTNPPDGEQVVIVEVVPVSEAAAKFQGIGRPDLADLYRLARELRCSLNH
ncbi:MAG: NUDIX hydrolase [Thermomicrobiales bacterium]